MSTNRDFDRTAGAWLAEGPSELADHVLEAALDEVHMTHQRRRFAAPWRTPLMRMPLRLAAAVAIIAVVGYAGLTFLNPRPNIGAVASPSPTPTALTEPTLAPTAKPEPTPLDTTGWTTYPSAQYGITISHPPEWTATAASRDWTFDADASLDPHAPALDSFISPNGQVRVSLWAIKGESLTGGPGEAIAPLGNIHEWAEEFCRATHNTPCEGVKERAFPMCLEYRDCHPATMVLYGEDVQAYFTGGGDTDSIVVVVVWRADNDNSTVEYGSSKNLLQAFLSTVNGGGNGGVWPMGYLPGRPPVLVTQAPTP